MKQQATGSAATTGSNPVAPIGRQIGGLAGWLLDKLRVARRSEPRLAVLERIALAPRQSLALVEAEGRRFLVATSPEGTPAFYALDDRIQDDRARKPAARVSW
jgi:flagellar biogenesis protein FliO